MGGSALCVIFSSDTHTQEKTSNLYLHKVWEKWNCDKEKVNSQYKKKIEFNCANALQCCTFTLPTVQFDDGYDTFKFKWARFLMA